MTSSVVKPHNLKSDLITLPLCEHELDDFLRDFALAIRL